MDYSVYSMGNANFKSILCLCILLFYLLSCRADKNCVKFVNLNTTVITAPVNTLVTLTFNVDNKCEQQSKYFVFIDRLINPFCVITFANGNCTNNSAENNICFCESDHGPLIFNKTMEKEDNGMWNWRIVNEKLYTLARTQIYFKIISNSRITNLTVDGKQEPQIILGKKDVLLICSWINGDPPSTANLLVNNRSVNSSRASGNIFYQLSASPEHSGVDIRCEANSSDRNMSTVVFMSETRPVFLSSSFKSFDVRPGKTFNFTFSVRIHKPEHLQCYLNKTKSFGVDIEISTMNVINCTVILCAAESRDSKLLIQQNISNTGTSSSLEEKCLCYFGGSPPDLSLTVAMHNDVTDLGSWRLTVSNGDGADHQDMFLLVMEEDKYHGDGFSLVTTLLLGTIPAVVVCCIFTYIVHVKKSHLKIGGPAKATENSLSSLSIHSVESKSQHHRISDIDVINLLPIHKLENSRDSGFLDINSLTAQE